MWISFWHFGCSAKKPPWPQQSVRQELPSIHPSSHHKAKISLSSAQLGSPGTELSTYWLHGCKSLRTFLGQLLLLLYFARSATSRIMWKRASELLLLNCFFIGLIQNLPKNHFPRRTSSDCFKVVKKSSSQWGLSFVYLSKKVIQSLPSFVITQPFFNTKTFIIEYVCICKGFF